MGVEAVGILWTTAWFESLSRSEQRLNGLISEDNDGGYGAEARGYRLVATSVGDPPNDLLASEFFQVVRGAGGAILCVRQAKLVRSSR